MPVTEKNKYLYDAAAEGCRLLREKGAGLYSVTASRTETKEFNVDGGEFSLMRTLLGGGVSMTAVKDGKRGSSSANKTDAESIARLADDAVSAAESGKADDAWAMAPREEYRLFEEGDQSGDINRLFDRTKELVDTITADYPKIVIEQLIVHYKHTEGVYMNSSGTVFEDISGAYSADIMFSAHEGEISSSFFSSGVVTANLDTPFIEQGSIKNDLESVERQLHTRAPEGKFTGVMVLTPDCLGSFIANIADNFVSDRSMLEGVSLWKDSLGEMVADESLTVRVAPLDPGVVCGERFTSEGFISENYDLIKNGRLENFMLSLYVANKTGGKRAPNSSGNFIVERGDKSIDDIIAGIDRGILVGRFSGGEPGASGEFSGVAKNSFLIENGKVTDAVSETMISGNLAQMLKNIRGISLETVNDGGGDMPYAAFDGITVSGK